jgi:hypothetical protein
MPYFSQDLVPYEIALLCFLVFLISCFFFSTHKLVWQIFWGVLAAVGTFVLTFIIGARKSLTNGAKKSGDE